MTDKKSDFEKRYDAAVRQKHKNAEDAAARSRLIAKHGPCPYCSGRGYNNLVTGRFQCHNCGGTGVKT